MTFLERLERTQRERNTLLCVGLDPDLRRLPPAFAAAERPLFAFNREIVAATQDLACAYKPQIAYYAALGAEDQLEDTISYIHDRCPEIPVILDAKRSDIGATAELYAREVFDRYGADAVTVNPYFGFDSIKPFADRKEKGVVVLCKTSNPGSAEFQDVEDGDGTPLYLRVAAKAAGAWNANGNILLVVGATYPGQMREIREIAGKTVFLVPGIGAQGGNVAQAMQSGLRGDGLGLVVNSSRAIIHADASDRFASAAREAALGLREEINRYR